MITKTEKALEKLKKELDVDTDKDLYCGTAFIIFEKQSHSVRVVRHFEVNLIRRAFSFLIYNIFK